MKQTIKSALTLVLLGAFLLLASHDATAQKKGNGAMKRGSQFVDQNGDGICDNFGTKTAKKSGSATLGKGYGPGDGTGNKGVGPKDGTGYGRKGSTLNGTGTCDGTGPKGNLGRKRGK